MKRYRPKGQPLRPISEILQTGEAAKIVQQIMDTHDPANASELFATILQAQKLTKENQHEQPQTPSAA